MRILTRVTATYIRVMLVLCACVTLSGSAPAATHWVSPTGASTWAACRSDTPLNGTAACSIGTANTNAAAGDIVYLRGGTYSISANAYFIHPSNSGTLALRITFVAYTGEAPIVQGDATTATYGANITTNYI